MIRKLAFQADHANKEFYLPSNIEDLCTEKYSYLFTLAVSAAQKQGYKMLKLDEVTYAPKLAIDTQREIGLKSFGVPLLSGTLPKCPQGKGSIRKGLYLFVHSRHTGDKSKLNLVLTKLDKVESLPRYLYGDPWGKGFDGEHRIVNFIIYLSRHMEMDESEIITYLKSTEEIKKEQGLFTNRHNSDVLSDQEKLIVNKYLENIRPLMKFSELKMDHDTVISGDLWNTVREEQNLLRTYKQAVDKIVNDRLTTLYSQFKGKNEKKKAQKTPVKALIAQIDDPFIFKHFNPTSLFALFGLSQVNHSMTIEGLAKFEKNTMSILTELLNKGKINSELYSMFESASAAYANNISEFFNN
jgi:hypothetical protein